MCGAGMSGRPSSTLGYERAANPYFSSELSENEFVDTILANVPPFPEYYKRMKQLNADGATTVHRLPGLNLVAAREFQRLVEQEGHVVIDLRDQIDFGASHIPGSFGIKAGNALATWASWVIPYDQSILLVADESVDCEHAVRSLLRVGLDRVVGCLEGGMKAWEAEGLPTKTVQQISPLELHNHPSVRILDVRSDREWQKGRIEGAVHIMCGHLADRLAEFSSKSDPWVVYCGTGYRSTVAASILQRAGFTNVMNLTDGIQAWKHAELPVVNSEEAACKG
jgi:hydroxyacylglutathione hydrolase